MITTILIIYCVGFIMFAWFDAMYDDTTRRFRGKYWENDQKHLNPNILYHWNKGVLESLNKLLLNALMWPKVVVDRLIGLIERKITNNKNGEN